MPITIDGTSGITFPAGGTGNTTGTAVGTTDTQTLTNKTLTTPVVSTISNSGTVTIPTGTNTLNVVGPAFSAWNSASFGALTANTPTRIAFQTEDFDTANCFDSSSTFRFTPNLAGYYQVGGSVQINGTTTSLFCAVYKNGSQWKNGSFVPTSSGSPISHVSCVVYLNGSTDYVELWASTGTSLATNPIAQSTYFNGIFIRA